MDTRRGHRLASASANQPAARADRGKHWRQHRPAETETDGGDVVLFGPLLSAQSAGAAILGAYSYN